MCRCTTINRPLGVIGFTDWKGWKGVRYLSCSIGVIKSLRTLSTHMANTLADRRSGPQYTCLVKGGGYIRRRPSVVLMSIILWTLVVVSWARVVTATALSRFASTLRVYVLAIIIASTSLVASFVVAFLSPLFRGDIWSTPYKSMGVLWGGRVWSAWKLLFQHKQSCA